MGICVNWPLMKAESAPPGCEKCGGIRAPCGGAGSEVMKEGCCGMIPVVGKVP